MDGRLTPEALRAEACAHCGLPVVTRRAPAGPLYCCLGCRLAAAAGGADGARGFLAARLLCATFLAMGVMTASLVLYSTELHARGDEPGLRALLDAGHAALALFSLPVLLLLGVPLLAGAAADLRAGRVRMDGLIVLATAAAFGLSLLHTWRGAGEVYFDTATMVLVLVTFGRRLEAHARAHARDAAAALAECLPRAAHRVPPGGGPAADVPPETLLAGDTCEVRPGEALPADAVVLAGRSEVACAHMTGEEAPRAVGPGDELPAGALDGAGALTVRVLRPAATSSLQRLRALLDAPLPATHLMRLTDRLAGWLAGLSILLAAAAGGWHAVHHDAGTGLRVALSVLLVACPCALGLAVPLAYRALRAALARRGVLVHDAAALERAARVDLVLLDKTGTLTDPCDARAVLLESRPGAGARLAALVAASGHALAPALAGAAGRADGAAPRVDGARLVAGRGASGTLDGLPACAGQPEWLDERGARWATPLAAARARWAGRGGSLVALEQDGEVIALACVEHGLRRGARAAVDALRRDGLQVQVLSGDRAAAAARIGEALDVPARGELSPEDKLDEVRRARAAGHMVLVAGDGVNDAPALREADVGVVVAGTAAARSQAGVELTGEDLRALPLLLSGARTLRRAVRANLGWTLAYNGVLLALAASGRLHPLLAAAAMIVSSLMVSARSWRLLHWAPEPAVRGASSVSQPGQAPVALAAGGVA